MQPQPLEQLLHDQSKAEQYNTRANIYIHGLNTAV